MTTRKDKLALTSRLTAFVTREEGAAEIRVSPSTWDEMERLEHLPKPYFVGPNRDLKRWYWPEVEDKIRNQHNDDDQQREPYFRGLARGAA